MALSDGIVRAWLAGALGQTSAEALADGRVSFSSDASGSAEAHALSNGSVTASIILEPSFYEYEA